MPPTPEFRPFVSGMSLKNGKLYVFSKKDVIVLKSWPDPRAWRRTKKKAWHCIRPHIRLDGLHADISPKESRQVYGIDDDAPPRASAPTDEAQPQPWDTPEFHRLAKEWGIESLQLSIMTATDSERAEPGWVVRQAQLKQAFFEAVPGEVRQLVTAFPGHHWHLLSMLARCPRSAELLISNPALGYALSHSWVYTGRKSKYAHKWVRRHLPKPQKILCGLLGFPPNESSVKILRKMEPRHCSTACLFDLRRLMADAEMADHLRHLPRVTPGVIKFLNLVQSKGWHVARTMVMDWYRYLQREPQPDNRHTTFLMVKDTLNMLPEDLGRGWTLPYQSLAGMRRAHDAANRRQVRIVVPGERAAEANGFGAPIDLCPWERYAEEVFNPAPVPGNKAIIPLATGREILDEAAAMWHCVASYIPRILEGKSYIYRVLEPERATLEIILCSDNSWEINQISGVSNRAVGPVTRKLIEVWLRAWQIREMEQHPF